MEERHDDKLIELIKEKSEEVIVPKNLQPDKIELLFVDKKKKSFLPLYRLVSCMAVVVMLVAGILSIKVFEKVDKSLSIIDANIPEVSQVASSNSVEETKEPIECNIKTASSYEALAPLIKEVISRNKRCWQYNMTMDFATGGELNNAMNSTVTMKKESASVTETSKTNVQVEGIDEGDIVKTDGEYIYVISNSKSSVFIISAKNGNMHKVSEINFQNNPCEMYIKDDILSIIVNVGGETKLLTYSVEDKSNPTLINTVTQDGWYQSSRFVDGIVYLFTIYSVYNNRITDPITYIPKVNNKMIKEDCISVIDVLESDSYLVMSSVTQSSGNVIETKSILGGSEKIYVSNDYIYITAYDCEVKKGDYNRTVIYKYKYDNGRITPVIKGSVPGVLNDDFAIDEYNGNLRLVTTKFKLEADGQYWYANNEKQTSGVYILDDALNIIGQVEDLAEGEYVYSARLMGDTGYFVTFRQVDPLFSVDLSDPTNPKIIGSLKIPGFSEYLHFYDDTHLLGIGRDADKDSGRAGALKLSMFDISNPKDVKEVHKYMIEDYESSEALYNYKAVMIDPTKNLFGFPMDKWVYDESNDNNYTELCYKLFTYDEKDGFKTKLNYVEKDTRNNWSQLRGMYIGNYIYIVNSDKKIVSYNMMDMEQTDIVEY